VEGERGQGAHRRGACVPFGVAGESGGGLGHSQALGDGVVLEAAAEEEVDEGGVEVEGGEFGGGLEADILVVGPPFGGSEVAEEAFDAPGGVGGPVDEADAGAGEEALFDVVLDDEGTGRDAGDFGEEGIGIGFVVDDVGEDGDVEGAVVGGDVVAVEGEDGDGFSTAGEFFAAGDDHAGRAGGVVLDGPAEGTDPATDIEDAVAFAEGADDEVGEDLDALGVDGGVEEFEHEMVVLLYGAEAEGQVWSRYLGSRGWGVGDVKRAGRPRSLGGSRGSGEGGTPTFPWGVGDGGRAGRPRSLGESRGSGAGCKPALHIRG